MRGGSTADVSPRLLAFVATLGPEGMPLADVAQAIGSTVRSVDTLIWRHRDAGKSTAYRRTVGGVAMIFRGDLAGPMPEHLAKTEAIRQKLIAAGKAGVPRSEIVGTMPMSTFSSHIRRLSVSGEAHFVSKGAWAGEWMYFYKHEDARAFLAARKEAAKKRANASNYTRKRIKRAAAPKLPRKKHVTTKKRAPAPFVLKPSEPKKLSPAEALKAAPVVNPRNVKPVVYPTPAPRFHVTHAPQHISANDCRPWARYA